MKVTLARGVIHDTDYFDSPDFRKGEAWLAVAYLTWHVLLPGPAPPGLTFALARPIVDAREPEGWRWRLELGDWHLPLRVRQIIGQRPGLVPRRTARDFNLLLYTLGDVTAAGVSSKIPRVHASIRLQAVRETLEKTLPLHIARPKPNSETLRTLKRDIRS